MKFILPDNNEELMKINDVFLMYLGNHFFHYLRLYGPIKYHGDDVNALENNVGSI